MNINKAQQYKVENAVIMAAGLSSRFAPLSYEFPKALLKVKGEVLIERQIRQLKEVGIDDITIVVGYKKELFNYLIDKFKIKIVENPEYNVRNNNSSLYYVREMLGNTYVCSADNYFTKNVFEPSVNHAYYSAVFEKGRTNEWCITTNETGLITDVKIGGNNAWVMLGHVFFSEEFSKMFVEILEDIYERPDTASLLWESIYIDNIKKLPMYIRKYPRETIFEFDTLDELREFDETYYDNTGSIILTEICKQLNCRERDIVRTSPIKEDGETVGFDFSVNGQHYKYNYKNKQIIGGKNQ